MYLALAEVSTSLILWDAVLSALLAKIIKLIRHFGSLSRKDLLKIRLSFYLVCSNF